MPPDTQPTYGSCSHCRRSRRTGTARSHRSTHDRRNAATTPDRCQTRGAIDTGLQCDEYKNMNSYKNSGSGSFGSQVLYCQHIGHTFVTFWTEELQSSHSNCLTHTTTDLSIIIVEYKALARDLSGDHKYSPTLNIIIKYFEHFLFDWN